MPTMNVDEYVNNIDAPLKKIVVKLRQAIMGTSKELREEMKWNVPTYSINRNICSIMAHKKHVNLQIFQGAKIRDSNKLEGSGKEMRHIKYAAIKEVKVTEVKKYLQQAIELDKQ